MDCLLIGLNYRPLVNILLLRDQHSSTELRRQCSDVGLGIIGSDGLQMISNED